MGGRTVITGASGMIGAALARQCAAAGEEVLAICHRGSVKNKILREMPGVEVLETDLGGYAGLVKEQWKKAMTLSIIWPGPARSDRPEMIWNYRFTISAVRWMR